MKKRFLLSVVLAVATLFSVHAVTVSGVAGKYSGTLTIAEDSQAGEILILPGTEPNTVSLVLPQFGFSGLNLGDIVVMNADLTSAGGISISNFPIYISVLETRAFATISTGSTLNGTNASLTLGIQVPSLGEGEIPVQFSGSRTIGTYQMPNAGFETNWHSVGSGVEPDNWHSFNSGTGTLIAATKNNVQLNESSDTRPGSTGSKSALIRCKYTNYVLTKVKANGNLTNGQINAASSSASDGSKNYNFSDPSNSGFNTQFAANPDSIVFWAKYIPADQNPSGSSNTARMHTVITTNARYQDPESTNYSSIKVAEATNNYRAANNLGWQRISTPFSYSSSVNADNAAYILVTFSTNSTPGGGTSNANAVDQIFLDDVEMIYNHELTSFVIDGENISFSNGVADTDKTFSDVSYIYNSTVSGRRSAAYVGFDAENNRIIIYTVAEDFAVNSNDYKVYTLNMAPASTTSLERIEAPSQQAQKLIINGRVYIRKGADWYNALGMKVARPL